AVWDEPSFEESFIAALEQLDPAVETGNVAPGQGMDLGIELEGEPGRIGQAAQDPVKRVARAGEGIDDSVPRPGRQSGAAARDIAADPCRQGVARALDRGPAEQTYAACMPFRRSHAVEPDIVGIRETVETIAPHFFQRELLIALGSVQQKGTVVARRVHAFTATRNRRGNGNSTRPSPSGGWAAATLAWKSARNSSRCLGPAAST